jgi:hypothetical protein
MSLKSFYGAADSNNKRKSVDSATTSTVEKVSSLNECKNRIQWMHDLKVDVGSVNSLKTDIEKLPKREGDLTGYVPILKTDVAGFTVTEPYKSKTERTIQVNGDTSTNLKRAILGWMNNLDKDLTKVKPKSLEQVCR